MVVAPRILAQTSKRGVVKATAQTSPKAAATPTTKSVALTTPRFIAVAAGVPVRSGASQSGRELAKLRLGSIVRASERSLNQQTIGGKTDYWYKIAVLDQTPKSSGWVFGGSLRAFEAGKAGEIYQSLADERLKFKNADFDDHVELYRFLERATPNVREPEAKAQLEFARLSALKNSLEAIPFDKQNESPYKEWLNVRKNEVVYSEPAGTYFVRSELLWNLSKKHEKLLIGEKIAWQAARITLPGECEGYINCYLYKYKLTDAEYLTRFPKGAHAGDALNSIGAGIALMIRDKATYTGPTDVSDRAEFYQTIADLRVIVSKTASPEKNTILRQLNQLAESYR